jgi:hypothetical protein
VIGKMLGRLAFRGWRDGWRADRRWAKGRDERLWQRDYRDEYRTYAHEPDCNTLHDGPAPCPPPRNQEPQCPPTTT